MKTMVLFLGLLCVSCVSIQTEHKGTKVQQFVFMQKIKSNTVDTKTGEIKTEFYESKASSVLKGVFNWSVLKGIYDTVWK